MVTIPADIDDGQTVRLAGAGEAIKGGIAGDLYIKIHVKDDKFFKKDGKDLVTELNIKITDAILGAKYVIKTLDGDIELKVPEGAEFGQILRIKGKGIPVSQTKRGDLLIKLNIQMPGRLSRKAKEDFDRAKSQYNDNIITKEQYDHTAKALDAAQAEYNISLTKPGLSKAQQEVITAQLKNGTIYSPIDGIIARKWALEGDIIQPGQPVYTIFDTKNIWITAEFEETRLGLIVPGDKVQIAVDAYPDKKFTGKVYQIGSNTASQFSLIPPNNASGNFTKVTQRVPVKILFDTNNAGLLPGMSVEVRVKEKN